jgi:7-carboxy-7-deazaguanine synthase (Cx14CxxC type)
MTYTVKEIFLTQQGEGLNIGRTAVFIRFAGCNLACSFCDTDFIGGARYDATDLIAAAVALAPATHRFAVLTGGEPALQIDQPLIDGLHAEGFALAIETNGMYILPKGIDWVCVSPKNTGMALTSANELKLPFPSLSPEQFTKFHANYFWLSPIDDANKAGNIAAAAEYCQANPQWRLAIQAHKTWSIP